MVSNICKNYYAISNRCNRFLFGFLSTETAMRPLYSLSSLGVDNYIKAREKVGFQFREIGDKFKLKMNEFVSNETNNMIFTEDLKNMVHLVQPNEEDLELVEKMLLKFCKQNKEMRFGSFIFGPVVMRMYYHHNKPNEALKVFKNPDMDGFFDQLISFQILLDLLYKNEMYTEMLDVFNVISNKQLQGSKYPKNAVVLVLAACYKMNTPDSFKFFKQLWSDLNEIGHYPMRKAGTFAAALAILQNSPDIALEILTSMKQQTYVTVRNLKVAALADLGRPDDALPLLRSVLEIDSPHTENKHTFCEEIVVKLQSAIEKTNKTELKHEFDRIEKQLRSLGYISKEPLDDLLCKEISMPNNAVKNDQIYSTRRTVNVRNQFQRPGLRNMV